MALPAGAVSSHSITFLNQWSCHWRFRVLKALHQYFQMLPFALPIFESIFQAISGEEKLEARSCFRFLHILFTESLNISCLLSKAHLIPIRIWANMARSLNKSSGKCAALETGAERQGNCCASEQRTLL